MNRYYWEREHVFVGRHPQSDAGSGDSSTIVLQIFDRRQPADEPIAHATSVESATLIVNALNALHRQGYS